MCHWRNIRPATGHFRSARQFGIVPLDISSQWSVDGRPEIVLFYLHASLMRQVAAELFGRDPHRIETIPGSGMVDALLEQLVLSVLGKLRQDEAGLPLYAESIATAAAVHLLRRHTAQPVTGRDLGGGDLARSNLRPALDFIEASLESKLGIVEIAAMTGLSTFYFARAFHRQLGMAPHRYLIACRVECVKTLLATSDQPLAELALSAGFSSQSHLTSIFKRVVGITLGVYRRG